MDIKDQMRSGQLYIDTDEELTRERLRCKELVYDYNMTRPGEEEKQQALIRTIFGSVGEHIFIEPPMHLAYGTNVSIGDYFYANFNMTIVDDIEVTIGRHVMFGPNVTLSVTGHPVHPDLREYGRQFSKPIHIGNHIWIGAGAIILPGITIGDNSVIGAGSVVTKDVPANVVAVGNPCRILREITDKDKEII